MSYRYVKAPPGYTLQKPRKFSSYLRLTVSAILLTLGVSAMTTVAYPLLNYQYRLAPRLVEKQESTPSVVATVPHAVATVQASDTTEPTFVKEMINTTLDYTDSSNWFPDATAEAQEAPDLIYSFSIPKLGIKEAQVVTSHTDLKKSLIQYPGTALPGDLGNTVIFGHSVLPQFFNPKNYITIFSTLHTLEEGDEIDISYDGIDYTYQIVDIYEVEPDNLQPLAQSYDGHHLTVITCTPPGTYLRRLIVKAELI